MCERSPLMVLRVWTLFIAQGQAEGYKQSFMPSIPLVNSKLYQVIHVQRLGNPGECVCGRSLSWLVSNSQLLEVKFHDWLLLFPPDEESLISSTFAFPRVNTTVYMGVDVDWYSHANEDAHRMFIYFIYKGPFPVPNGSQTVWRFARTEEDWRFILLVERNTAPIVCYKKHTSIFTPNG